MQRACVECRVAAHSHRLSVFTSVWGHIQLSAIRCQVSYVASAVGSRSVGRLARTCDDRRGSRVMQVPKCRSQSSCSVLSRSSPKPPAGRRLAARPFDRTPLRTDHCTLGVSCPCAVGTLACVGPLGGPAELESLQSRDWDCTVRLPIGTRGCGTCWRSQRPRSISVQCGRA